MSRITAWVCAGLAAWMVGCATLPSLEGRSVSYEASDGLVDGAVGYRGDEDVPVILTQRFATRCTAHRGEMHDARVRNHRRYGRIGVFGFELIAGVAFPKFNYRFALHRRPPEMLTCVMA